MDFFEIGEKLKPAELSPEEIYLDPNNPRFKGEKDYNLPDNVKPTDRKVQEKIFNFLVRNKKYDISELKNSISRVGFLRMDRIVVSKLADSAYVVLEGNRRVAAIKWILKDIEERNLTVKDFVLDSLKKIKVLELDGSGLTPNDLQKATWFLQGVRHISGIKQWGPYQQAELIKQFIDSGLTFTDAGQSVGVGPRKAGQMMRAYSALIQMQNNDEFSELASPDLFSHFEQTFIKSPIKNWLGWDEDKQIYTNKNELRRFYELITPGENGKPDAFAMDVREKLPTILESSNATDQLMNGQNMEFCFGLAVSEKTSAPTWHASVKEATKKVKSIPWSYPFSSDDIDLLKNLLNVIRDLLKTKGLGNDEQAG